MSCGLPRGHFPSFLETGVPAPRPTEDVDCRPTAFAAFCTLLHLLGLLFVVPISALADMFAPCALAFVALHEASSVEPRPWLQRAGIGMCIHPGAPRSCFFAPVVARLTNSGYPLSVLPVAFCHSKRLEWILVAYRYDFVPGASRWLLR